MVTITLPIGCYVRVEKPALQAILDRLRELGYHVVGPTVADGAIVYADLTSIDELPVGISDAQDAATYRLHRNGGGAYFDYVVGPHSLKDYLFPPRATLLECQRHGTDWEMRVPELPSQPLAILGPRSCDLHALAMQDRIFLGDRFVNPDYEARRKGLFVLAINCGRAASTCFCTSMGTGPAVSSGFDLALTELPGHFVLEVGTELGGRVAAAAPWVPCSTREIAEAQAVPRKAEIEMEERRRPMSGQPHGRYLDTSGLHDLLLNNLDHDHWDEVADRCLACGNCTMVCPTCFCCSVQEVADLTGSHVRRERFWDTCFNADHSYMNSGTVRKLTRARYRQWLTHKLATWIDQFGSSGCVGCGRCITWCPVGIDLTAEVAAIRGGGPP